MPPSTLAIPSQGVLSAHSDRTIRHFNQVDLSRRWSISPRTLERWRWLKEGPRYLKIGGRVVYRIEDIEAFEKQHVREVEQPGMAGHRGSAPAAAD
jgi:hypothetical protein